MERNQELFNHLSNEHGLVLLESEIDEIVCIAINETKKSLLVDFKKWHSSWSGKWFSDEHEESIVESYLKGQS